MPPVLEPALKKQRKCRVFQPIRSFGVQTSATRIPISSMLSIKVVAHATWRNHCLVLATVGDESQEAPLFDPPLERDKSNDAGCNHFSQIFKFDLHTFCNATSGHGSECRSSKMPKLALVQLITFGSLNDAVNL